MAVGNGLGLVQQRPEENVYHHFSRNTDEFVGVPSGFTFLLLSSGGIQDLALFPLHIQLKRQRNRVCGDDACALWPVCGCGETRTQTTIGLRAAGPTVLMDSLQTETFLQLGEHRTAASPQGGAEEDSEGRPGLDQEVNCSPVLPKPHRHFVLCENLC